MGDPLPATAVTQKYIEEAKGSLEMGANSPAVDWGEPSPAAEPPTDAGGQYEELAQAVARQEEALSTAFQATPVNMKEDIAAML